MENYHKYLNIAELEENWGFHVNTVGSARIGPNTNYPNNRQHPSDHTFTWDKGRILNSYYVVYITKGEGMLESAKGKPVKIQAGSCFLLFPGVWHRYKPSSNSGWEEYWIGFNGEYPKRIMDNALFSPQNAFIDVGLNEELLAHFHSIIKSVKVAEVGYRQAITGIVLQILALLYTLSKYKATETDPQMKLIAKAKFLLQESIDSPVNLEEMVNELPMGYSSFRKAFKKLVGISPNQYHLDLRLDKAKDLLNSTNLTINEVAYKTGFSSIFYFSRLFKKRNGVPPKYFRKSNEG
ncbi:MAG: AraC family transcriptional regulator [Pedobacter sp.]|nr:MAG: AraC family transcriptional regulator [Pedobacter sp.]